MPILGPDGKPIVYTTPIQEEAKGVPAPFRPTRQLIRAYMRKVAIAHINRHFGPEPKRVRKSLARDLAKRPQFIKEVRNATKAF